MKPLVSIIMAVKNTEPYLPDCLDSVIAQTYTNWELITVNDHSTDKTPEILAAYTAKDRRIRVFNSPGHRLNPALWEGYRRAEGILINRMDSDDKMPEYKLALLVSEWQKYGKGTVIAGGTKHFVDKGEVGQGFRRYEQWLNDVARNNRHYEEIYQECVIPSHCWIIHRDDFDAVGAFAPDIYPEDYDLCFRFYKQRLNIVGVDAILHFWRDRLERISRTWEEYKDNRYFELKLRYFYELDRDISRPLVLWGAGTNGKDMARLLQIYDDSFLWVCDNQRKVGETVYNVPLLHYKEIPQINNPQIMIVVTSPTAKIQIRKHLAKWGKEPVKDFWFFA